MSAKIFIIRTLGALGAIDAIPALINALENDSSDCRNIAAEAAEALGKLGAINAVPALIHALDDEIYYDVYINTIEALGKIGSEAAISVLTRSLEKEHLRKQAARALAKFGDPVAISILINCLTTERDFWLNYAIESLVEVGNERGISAIVDALDSDLLSIHALQALGRSGNTIAIPTLIKALTNQDYHTRCEAVAALCKICGESKIPILINILETDENHIIRIWVVRAIANLIKNEAISVIQSLTEALKDSSYSVRKSFVEILGELGDPMFIHALINALSDEHYSVRICAAKALSKFDNEIAIPALINSLTNKDWWVGYYSIEALEKFSGRAVVRDALLSIISNLTSSVGIMPAAVQTLKTRSAHALGFYNYEIEKLNLE